MIFWGTTNWLVDALKWTITSWIVCINLQEKHKLSQLSSFLLHPSPTPLAAPHCVSIALIGVLTVRTHLTTYELTAKLSEALLTTEPGTDLQRILSFDTSFVFSFNYFFTKKSSQGCYINWFLEHERQSIRWGPGDACCPGLVSCHWSITEILRLPAIYGKLFYISKE